MALTPEQIDRIDNRAATKADLQDALHEHKEEHPGLLDITEEKYKRDEMIARAKEVIADEMTDQAKVEAMQKLVERRPDAVVIPIVQPYMILRDPKGVEENIILTVYSEMGNTETSPRAREVLPENEREPYGTVQPNSTLLDGLPRWALLQLYDMIEKRHVRVFESAEEASRYNGLEKRKEDTPPILDDVTASPSFEHARAKTYGDQKGAVYQRVAKDRLSPERKAARAVLFETVNGEPPLPIGSNGSRKDISPDPSSITQTEIAHVRRRIRDCLDNPRRWTQDSDLKTFDKRTFFSQLLKDEISGFTPPRVNDHQIAGRLRPAIVKLIRTIASEEGFDVVGDYAVPRPIEELEERSVIPDTVPLTPEKDRKMDYPKQGARHPEEVSPNYFG